MSLHKILLLLLISSIAFGEEMASEMETEQHFKDYILAAGDTLDAQTHVKVYVGDAHIAGIVDGIITLYAGHLYLDSTAVINGSIKLLGGKVAESVAEESLQNNILEANLKGVDLKSTLEDLKKSTRLFIDDQSNDIVYSKVLRPVDPIPAWREPMIRFNRQEGFYLEMGDLLYNLGKVGGLDFTYKIGYAFDEHRWQGAAQLRYSVFEKHPLTGYGWVYHENRHHDCWRLPDLENSLAFLINKEDYHDRYKAEGYRLGIRQRFGGWFTAKGEYVSQLEWNLPLYESEHNNLRRPLSFGEADSGKVAGLKLSAELYLGKSAMHFPGIFQIGAILEQYDENWQSDYNFDRLTLKANYIGTIGSALQIRSQAISAVNTGNTPVQYAHWLGGMGSIRGHAFKSLSGHKMILFNQELAVGFDDDLWALGFIDMGYAGNISPEKDIWQNAFSFNPDHFKRSFGFGFETGSLSEWGIRVDWARDLDNKDAPWVSYLRMSRMF
jgi:hypothetical protein